jgi:hypothetical protein
LGCLAINFPRRCAIIPQHCKPDLFEKVPGSIHPIERQLNGQGTSCTSSALNDLAREEWERRRNR